MMIVVEVSCAIVEGNPVDYRSLAKSDSLIETDDGVVDCAP